MVKVSIVMPTVFRVKDKTTNLRVLIVEIPSKLTPNSSGKGDAIIKVPIIMVIQPKYLECIKTLKCLLPNFL